MNILFPISMSIWVPYELLFLLYGAKCQSYYFYLFFKIEIQKKINKRVSTRGSPCVKYEYNTCQNIEANKLVLDQFSCQIPILYYGHHLDNLIPDKIPNCNENVTKVAVKLLQEKGKSNQTECFCFLYRCFSYFCYGFILLLR